MTAEKNMKEKIPCSVEILTLNSADTLERCLQSVADFGDIMVLDGGSTDGTREIAERFGARVMDQEDAQGQNQPITDFAAVRNRGMAAARHDWFMYIDSDEYLSPESTEEIRSIAASAVPAAYVWRMPRRYVCGGRIIDCSLGYPNFQARFFDRRHVAGFIKSVHERIEPRPGERVLALRAPTYVPLASGAELRKKFDGYIRMEDLRLVGAGRPAMVRKIWHIAGVLARNTIHIRKVIWCRGARLPFFYEWLRFEYHLKLAYFLVKRFIAPRRKL